MGVLNNGIATVYNVELIYIGITSKFFIHGQHYIMEFWEAFNQCTDETGNKHLWTIDEIFKQFVTPVVWGKMRN